MQYPGWLGWGVGDDTFHAGYIGLVISQYFRIPINKPMKCQKSFDHCSDENVDDDTRNPSRCEAKICRKPTRHAFRNFV